AIRRSERAGRSARSRAAPRDIQTRKKNCPLIQKTGVSPFCLQCAAMSNLAAPSPLTVLSEDEALFRDSVHDFAQAEIAPIAHQMDASGRYEPALIGKLFEMGLMGIDVPEQYGGAAGSFFLACLA